MTEPMASALGRLSLGAVLLACAATGPTVRKHAERSYPGRYVPTEAYAQHLRASLRALEGNDRAAEADLQRALRKDPGSAHLAAAIAELRCRSDPSSGAGGLRQLASRQPESARVWLALSRCLARLGQEAPALAAAKRAVAAEPNSVEASAEVVERYVAGRDLESARRWALALSLRAPSDQQAQQVWRGVHSPAGANKIRARREECLEVWRAGGLERAAQVCSEALAVRPAAWNARAIVWLSGGALGREPVTQARTEPLLQEVQEAIQQRVQDTVGPRAAQMAARALKVSALHGVAVQSE